MPSLSTRSAMSTIFRTIYPAPCPGNGACRLAPCNIYTKIRAANSKADRPVKLQLRRIIRSAVNLPRHARSSYHVVGPFYLRWSGCVKRGALSSISRAQLKRAFARLTSPMKLAWMLESHITVTHCETIFPIGCMTSDEDDSLSGGFVLLLRSLNN